LCNRDVSYVKIVRFAQDPWCGHNRDSWCKWQYFLPEKWETWQPTLSKSRVFLSCSADDQCNIFFSNISPFKCSVCTDYLRMRNTSFVRKVLRLSL
jgi:hypothetical protein